MARVKVSKAVKGVHPATRMRREMKLQPMVPLEGKCNATLPGNLGQLCLRPAGQGTDHPRVGPCSWHDQRPEALVKQRYLQLLSQKSDLRAHLTKAARHERHLMDIEPEVALLRALLARYIDEYEELRQAMFDWSRDMKRRIPPRAVPDISQAIAMIDKVSVLVERIHKMKQKSSISVETLRRIIEAMGVVVARHVSDITALKAIEAEWGNLTLNAKTQQRVLPAQHSQDTHPQPHLDEVPIVPDEPEGDDDAEDPDL